MLVARGSRTERDIETEVGIRSLAFPKSMNHNETIYWLPGKKDALKRRRQFGWALVFGLGALVCIFTVLIYYLSGTQ